ncbi:dienelactone hydrolase family protein [Bremerella cremea]|uniref:carboxylesterase family protein n=1 Tax=Bremerella cremea TaxID=1031537 RepID=UPI0031EB4BD8
MKLTQAFCLALLLLFPLVSTVQAEEKEPAALSEETFDLPGGKQMHFLLYLPKGYEEQEHWPLVLFLHGAGERGDDLSKVKKHGPPKLVENGQEFPFIMIAPQCPQGTWWITEDLVALMDHIVEIHNVDESRVYVTGLSMGGRGTWQVAGAMSDKLAAIAPICGPSQVEVVEKIVNIPTWVFHGAKDPVVKVSQSEEMVKLLKEKGGNPKLTIYPEALHDSWTETYDNEEVFKWLLSHQLPKKEDEAKPE